MYIAIDARIQAYRGGGISEHVARLIEGLAELGATDEFLVLRHRKADPGAPSPFPVRHLWTPPHHRWEGWTLPLEIAFDRLSVLHSPDTVVPRGWKRGSVVTVHDLAFLRRPELLTPDSAAYYRGVLGSVLQAHRIIAVSEYTRSELLALTRADPERIHVIPNAVHPRFEAVGQPDVDAATVARYGLTGPYLLFVSTIEPRKNIPVLLDAYKRLVERGCRLPLVLVGADGWHSASIYAHAQQLGLDGQVKFLGFVPDADLPALYRRASVLAHPAVDEGFGLTPLEAMASGTPTVVALAGSLQEVTGSAALTVPAGDVQAWADALERVLGDPAQAKQLSELGRARATGFTLQRMAQATLEVYHLARADWASERV